MQSKTKQTQHLFTWGTIFPTPQTDISCSFLLPLANMRRSSIPNICICQLYLVPEPESKIVNGTRLFTAHERKDQALQSSNHQ